jgi:hypothetical protein
MRKRKAKLNYRRIVLRLPDLARASSSKLYSSAPHVRPATTQQWNLALQQQLSSDTTFQFAYMGQHGTPCD